jgi:DNA mismatch repair protein MutL
VIPTDTQLHNALGHSNTSGNNPASYEPTSPNMRFNPFDKAKERTATDWEKLDDLLNTPVHPSTKPQQEIWATPETASHIEIDDIFQVENAFIIAKIAGELSVISQHRAHAQILYERYQLNQLIASQQLLFPRTIELSKADYALYLDIQDQINALGFDTSEFGKNAIIINGLPSELSKADGANVVIQILDDFKTNYQDLKINKTDAIRQATAKNAAIKAGKILSAIEMKSLVSDLLHCKQYTADSAGKSIIIKLSKSSLERFFH